MEDPEGVLNLDSRAASIRGPRTLAPPCLRSHPTITDPQWQLPPITADTGNSNTTTNNNRNSGAADFLAGRRSFRQTVWRHWLRSLCMKGDACGFLHQYDKSRMPVCRFFLDFTESAGSRIAFTSTPMKISRRAICTSWGFVPMIQTAGIGMQNCLDLHLRL
ncbi:ZINC FINGER CCCH DOMAIN-CONTAINING PROTEIN 45 [Salix viminalis]|uniref:ZINC FINGER CCCH DOMAIN-CONTAINING PROTEIN 45 n=1 Tax=Salix viminalis TaxID=40686 RepID=A0A9Q0Z822_SALVM|nr:ZINC FINGER CCCH DOMAIN-CONTAINING PROTEIN 45 [Salix viminalis]